MSPAISFRRGTTEVSLPASVLGCCAAIWASSTFMRACALATEIPGFRSADYANETMFVKVVVGMINRDRMPELGSSWRITEARRHDPDDREQFGIESQDLPTISRSPWSVLCQSLSLITTTLAWVSASTSVNPRPILGLTPRICR